MTSQRLHFGRCSFIAPEGFVLEPAASRAELADAPDACACGNGAAGAGLCLTLSAPGFRPVAPGISENPDDLSPAAYPVRITLTVQPAAGLSPAAYLKQTSATLKAHLPGFKDHFFRQTRVGSLPASRSHYSFQAGFPLHYLNVAWCIDTQLVIATLAAPETGVKNGWKNLIKFVDSVRLHAGIHGL